MKKNRLLYALQMVKEADPFLLSFTLFKNSIEQIFYVFFFVYLTKYIFQCIENNTPFEKLFRFLIFACLGHVCIHFICGWYETYKKIKMPEVYRTVFHKVMDISDELKLEEYEDPKFYDDYSRALDNCVETAMEVAIKTGVFIGNVAASVMSLVMVISVDPFLMVFMIVPIIASFYYGKRISKCNYDREKAITRDKRISEYVKRVYYEKKYAAEIRLFDKEGILIDKQKESYKNMEDISLKYRVKTALYSFVMYGSYSIFAGIGAYLYVALVVKSGSASNIAGYVAMVSAMAFSSSQLKEAVSNAMFVSNETKLFTNLQDFLNRPVNSKDEGRIVDTIETIELRNVSFTYKGADSPTIKNVSLVLKRGEKVALVGYNGAGKTTLVKLLMGLYPVSEGRILINGIDIEEYNKKSVRDRIGTVFQDLQVFSITLCENVLMRRPSLEGDYEKARQALKKAQFDVDEIDLPCGLDTMITREFDENGFVCSGGQAQKIAIARVFAADPDMVILDEPSSALDPLAEYNMYKNMDKLSENKGVIFISHRLSSARMANHIYMMKHGEILEQGTHDELMDKKGDYYNMFMLQAQNYQESLPEELLKGEKTFYE